MMLIFKLIIQSATNAKLWKTYKDMQLISLSAQIQEVVAQEILKKKNLCQTILASPKSNVVHEICI